MTLNYFIQHKLFKDIILNKAPKELLIKAIKEEDGDFFAGLLTLVVNYVVNRAPEEKDKISYETDFITEGDLKIARYKFTEDTPPRPAECSAILIAVTDTIYYFTLEHSFGGGFMLCRWDGESHLNYGFITSDDTSAYLDTLIKTIKG